MNPLPSGQLKHVSFIRRRSTTPAVVPSSRPELPQSKDTGINFPSGFKLSSEDFNFEIPANRQVVIGRQSESDLVLEDTLVSRKHALLQMREGKLQILDPGSRNGTFINGERLKPGQWHKLEAGSQVKMGNLELKLSGPSKTFSAPPADELSEQGLQTASQTTESIIPGLVAFALRDLRTGRLIALDKNGPISVGRAPESDVNLQDPKVSRRHALLQVQDGSLFLQDKASTNGTSVNGETLVPQTWNLISPGAHLQIGDSNFQLTNASPLNLNSKSELEKVIDFRELIVDPSKQQKKYGELIPEKPNSYWQNNAEARQVFTDYLNRGDFADAGAFESMLKSSHKIAVEGSSGDSRYYKKRDALLGPEALPGGEFHPGVMGGIRNEESRQVEVLAKQYGDPYRADSTDPVPPVRLSGIEEEDCPRNVTLPGGQRHIYPQPKAFPDYFRQMRERLEKLDKLSSGAKAEKLQTIGEFYQYGANARPFHNVNNSLFMNMTNALLKRHGFAPVYHGILDHAAHRLQPKAFQEHFRDWAQGPGQIPMVRFK